VNNALQYYIDIVAKDRNARSDAWMIIRTGFSTRFDIDGGDSSSWRVASQSHFVSNCAMD
jgi:hypothetical protein